jgi:hypothetical protein
MVLPMCSRQDSEDRQSRAKDGWVDNELVLVDRVTLDQRRCEPRTPNADKIVLTTTTTAVRWDNTVLAKEEPRCPTQSHVGD